MWTNKMKYRKAMLRSYCDAAFSCDAIQSSACSDDAERSGGELDAIFPLTISYSSSRI